MKPFAALMAALVASAAGEINHVVPGGPSGVNTLMGGSTGVSNGQPSFAESRTAGGVDSYGAPSAPIVDSYSSSSNAAAWANDPVPQAYPYNFGGGASFAAPGFNANAEVGVPGQGLLNTALTIVFGLVAFSMIIQVIKTIVNVPFIANLVGQARSMDAHTMMDYTNMAMNGIQKMKDLYENLE